MRRQIACRLIFLGLGLTFAFAIVVARGGADEKQQISEERFDAVSMRVDEDAIRTIVIATSDAWNRKDAKAFAGFYLDDADAVNSRGVKIKGRKQIEAFIANRFASEEFRRTQHKRTSIDVRFLTPTCAIVDSEWEMGAGSDDEGAEFPVRKGSSTMVFVKQAVWRIAATRSMVPASQL